jgi:hypothetical protein
VANDIAGLAKIVDVFAFSSLPLEETARRHQDDMPQKKDP